jgi:hypothetical protein
MTISKLGTQTIDYGLVFDTGSGGLVIDASGILPASMYSTSSGFNITGDSTVIDGITITNQSTIVEYGDDNSSISKVYGNLAYASVTLGETDGNVVVKRLPFFLYYNATDGNGNAYGPHEFDVLGVYSGYDMTFNNGAYITSPFSYYTPGTGLVDGFKLAELGTGSFSFDGTYVPGVVTVGLTSADLSTAGFNITDLHLYDGAGYLPLLTTTVNYGTGSTSTDLLFDTGTPGYSYIEDKNASSTLTLLPNDTQVSLTTSSNFTDTYTTSASENLTYIENPTTSGAEFSIESIEFFLYNEYMIDYTDHKLGLKND